ncbi:MAG: hypothetical protein HGA67_00070 [Candidatus Yonathbacteria bacterium]|nr:hypothetical protein [Candidatus Yonathbacteria bacterium]
MESIPQQKTWEDIEKELQEKIASAKKHALTWDQYSETTKDEHAEEVKEIVSQATVFVETLPEFRRALELLSFDDTSLLDTLVHENAHGNKADELGAEHQGYKIILINNGDGRFAAQPQSYIYIPDEWAQEKQDATLNEIYKAPEAQGNALSPDDKEKLDGLIR